MISILPDRLCGGGFGRLQRPTIEYPKFSKPLRFWIPSISQKRSRLLSSRLPSRSVGCNSRLLDKKKRSFLGDRFFWLFSLVYRTAAIRTHRRWVRLRNIRPLRLGLVDRSRDQQRRMHQNSSCDRNGNDRLCSSLHVFLS